ncbi:MAG: Protein ChrB [Planctomycetes bacterium]|nr:Protein ChrB [Planctomycetota bacterium]
MSGSTDGDRRAGAGTGTKWVTRKGIRVNRAATAWLIRRFVDPDATFLFVEPGEVAAVQAREGARGFDAPGADFPHEDAKGRTSFEQLALMYQHGDQTLREMGRIVGSADLPPRLHDTAEGAGLRAVCRGFPLVCRDDHETVERSKIVFDALYASVTERLRSDPE